MTDREKTEVQKYLKKLDRESVNKLCLRMYELAYRSDLFFFAWDFYFPENQDCPDVSELTDVYGFFDDKNGNNLLED
jgi:hypothetical protein